ncbi:hypothetical protein FXO38_26575 [Capsicum annuum]|uniref:Uncharacterized protein n=1 Tax=Capsicum annuum TaxID=4072 RepID=A0A1U8FXB7_CAPAN|nr:uncharacterized protein LOC107860304 [Capsicum annuum]KAF3615329.1 hypothetical protein FXO37_35554 [Capsicum annuum]KAF3631663.1 hypothetical protein FXO38_26575 [Capsicum annuum]PHT91600.1 hypothetical protein T459_06713 [Capsicum annuum]
MANHGGVGSKFVSVNLNKSYGQSFHHHDNKSYSGSYGQAAAVGRGRSGSGGMVVLSRHRSAQKVGPKLSVPPPLNLPSLRKEHEKFDLSGSGGGTSGGGGQGSGPRPSSSGIGWTKPAAVALQEKDVNSDGQVVDGLDHTGHGIDGINQVSGSYMPPSARVSGTGAAVTGPAKVFPSTVEKVSVLRGEDFPSLQAALPVSSGQTNKQKDSLSQKQKRVSGEGSSDEQRDSYNTSLSVDMRPHGHSSRHATGNGPSENGYEIHGLSTARRVDQPRKQDDFFPGPLPLVRLNPRFDWADDERDTGHGFSDRGRDIGISKVDNYWDRDFDMPRTSVLPHKAAHNQYERRAARENLTGNGFSTDQRGDSYGRDLRIPSREGREASTWRNSILPRDGNVPDVATDRNAISSGGSVVNKDIVKENKYVPPHFGDTARDGSFTGNRDYSHGRNDTGLVTDGKQRWNHATTSSNNRGVERITQDRLGSELSNRYRRDGFQTNAGSKSSFASVGRSPHMGDPVLNVGREKNVHSRGERPYKEDPYLKDFESAGFDERDLFSGGLTGVIKRKKDVAKQTDFYDPVRESFEAELERVQKMQELERQRVMEEQERALEQARREEEERQRLIREEEERRLKLEEEAREAAWRAEKERLDAVRRAEEQRIAREEEKRRIFMEEERRKQAAKQKLLELEAKIAKRQTEVTKVDTLIVTTDEKVSAMSKEIDVSGASDLDNWDESERMVERLTTSASFDTPVLSRSSDVSSQHYSREGFTDYPDRGRPFNSWRGDVFENGSSSSMHLRDQDIGHHSPRRDVSAGGRAAAPRKDLSGATGYLASGSYARGGREGYTDEFGHRKEHRWNVSMDADPYIRNRDMDAEFNDNLADRYGDLGWGQARSRGNTRFPYPDRLYQNSEADEPYSYGKSRYAVRQPRVLPPPSLSTMQRTFRRMNDHPGSSNLVDNESHYPHPRGGESTRQTGYFGGHPSELIATQQESALADDKNLNKDMTPRCDSQSSLSVTSPPNSPPHLSHDELDDSEDSPSESVMAEGKNASLSGYECTLLNDNSAKDAMKMASSSLSATEDEDWNVEDNGELQQQEEYDEDDDGYREEDEVREADDENLDLNQEFEDLQLGEGDSSHNLDNLVLGFDDGVEVALPSDDFERNSRNEESVFDRPETSEGGSINGVQVDEKCLHPVEGAPGPCLDSSSDRVQEAEKIMQQSECRPSTEPLTSAASHLLDGVDAYCCPSLCPQQTFSSVGTPSSVGQTSVSSITSSSQPDLPVKLQFGLFSGPSLIPSPVPAIQIGSIQMPLHLHPPVGPSLSHMHPSQPPIFQFGQLRYSSTVTQGILPITAQPMSFGQPNVQAHYNANQNSGGSMPPQPSQGASTSSQMKDNVQSLSANQGHGSVVRPGGPHESKPVQGSAENKTLTANIAGIAGASDRKLVSELDIQVEAKSLNNADRHVQPSKEKESDGNLSSVLPSIQSVSYERNSAGGRAQGRAYSNKGKRFTYAVKSSSFRSSFPVSDGPYSEPSRFQRRPRRTVQRTEFRIRENSDSRQSYSTGFSNDSGHGDNLNHGGRAATVVLAKSGSKRGSYSGKILKQNVELDSKSTNADSQEVDSGIKPSKDDGRESLHKNQNISHSGEGNLKRNVSEEDVDAPLQSGVVRVFKQPGIEAPSDEDDFIEVRSKRQMLNDRREQREKEIKAKSRVSKPPRKLRTTRQSSAISNSPNKISVSVGVEIPNKSNYSDIIGSEVQGSVYKDVSTGFTTVVSQPLAPIGTPAGSSGSQADKQFHTAKSHQTPSSGGVSAGGDDLEPGLMFESKKNAENVTSSPLNSWGSAQINQQVMALSQSQLEEAMNPARFEAHVASVGAHGSAVTESVLPSPSILTKDKSFSSAASPINSLLAGEKIQFGAVTSPTVLHTSSRVVSHGIGAPGSNRSEVQISRNISPDENDCTLFFEKDKCANDPCLNVQDSEAEAEAAASAVAVAAISSDEMVGSGLGSAISEAKPFEGDQQLSSQSRAEESLSVSLPADLNVETPPISLWPPLPSPQNSSSQILSHFPGGPPSHFPFYEMNPVLGGPIFAFGPHKESGGSQSQAQKATVSSSAPLGAWQQCHSTLDSFYGHPAGFTGPFLSPPGGIPGVQGPPHMVVYNHFAPVGQYGQVGLSFMGTTYLPSGKQPDWKHTPSSSAMGITEVDMNNVNMTGSQRNLSNMPATVQHLGPASPIMPIASPLAMFDVSPFQTSPEMPVQARWSHVPASPLHSVPISHPLQQQAEGTLPPKFGHGHSVDQPLNTHRFLESHPPEASDGTTPSFTVATDANAAHFPVELGLGDSSKSGATGGSAQSLASQSSSGCANADAGKIDVLRNGVSNSGKDQGLSGFKMQTQQKNASAQQNQTAGYNYHRGGGMSQRNMSGNDWPHRRMGFHGRNQSLGAVPSTKVKQIYVAKQTLSGTKTMG